MYKSEKYDAGDVILSIGCFSVNSLREWQAHTRCLIVDYEATPEIYLSKRELEKNNGESMGVVECHPEAVTDKDGRITLYRFQGGVLGNTVVNSAGWSLGTELNDFVGTLEIDSVSMMHVLKRFSAVKELWLNCEGSEIGILMNTPLEELTKCAYISVEFHRFSTFLNITNGSVMACVQRLSQRFKAVCGEDYHPYYEFFRKP